MGKIIRGPWGRSLIFEAVAAQIAAEAEGLAGLALGPLPWLYLLRVARLVGCNNIRGVDYFRYYGDLSAIFSSDCMRLV